MSPIWATVTDKAVSSFCKDRGAHDVFPIQGKGGSDKLNMVEPEQDFAVCAAKFPNLVCNAIAAQFMKDDLIALSSSRWESVE